MRPIEKLKAGDTVRFLNSQGQEVTHIIEPDYPVYGEAKMPLTGNIGRYCSYCEGLREVDALDVEHLAAKSQGGSETAWNNFLLCCKVCNSVKGSTVIDDKYHWPHLNNTFLSFIYCEDGRIKVNPDIPKQSKVKAENLLNLLHLQRFPGTDDNPTPKDFRWKRRYEAWNKAMRCRDNYTNGRITEDDVISYAKDIGHWSIWFTVFTGNDTILKRLISDFPGTCASCFDATNHYAPIYRNPGSEDPV